MDADIFGATDANCCECNAPREKFSGASSHPEEFGSYEVLKRLKYEFNLANLSIICVIRSNQKRSQLRMRCNLKAARRRTSRSGLFGHLRILFIRTNCYFCASDQNFDIAVEFCDPHFLKGSINLTTRRRFHAVTLTFDPLTLNFCSRWVVI